VVVLLLLLVEVEMPPPEDVCATAGFAAASTSIASAILPFDPVISMLPMAPTAPVQTVKHEAGQFHLIAGYVRNAVVNKLLPCVGSVRYFDINLGLCP
jgi:hypothetical protein